MTSSILSKTKGYTATQLSSLKAAIFDQCPSTDPEVLFPCIQTKLSTACVGSPNVFYCTDTFKQDLLYVKKASQQLFYSCNYQDIPTQTVFTTVSCIDRINNDPNISLLGSKATESITFQNGSYSGTINMQPYSLKLIDVVPIPGSAPAQLPGWTWCAYENGQCSFTGTKEVRFGTTTKSNTKTLTGGNFCSWIIFGDPAPGTIKQCWYRDVVPLEIAGTGCGNGVINIGEACDGINLNGKTCATQKGAGYDGTLSCNAMCQFNTTACIAPAANKCGNGVIDTGEQCDPQKALSSYITCASKMGTGYTGTLSCGSACMIDLSKCVAPVYLDVECIRREVTKRETSLITALDVYHSEIRGIIKTRNAALKEAWVVDDRAARKIAIKTAWTNFRAGMKTATGTRAATKKSAWATFRENRKACGKYATSDDYYTSYGVDSGW